jgi:hypothetical protein
MSIPNGFSTRVVRWVAAASLAIMLGAVSVVAQSSSANSTFLVGAGFLCDSSDSSACPAVVKSADGASYEMSGAGMLNAQSKSVTAAGTFTHKSPDGGVLETGVWIASELISFDSYGIAPGALMREGRALGPPRFGPMPMGMLTGSMPAGGLAVLRIRLLPVVGFARNATLEVNCALGKVPAEHQTEGIRVAFEKGGVEYDEEVSGRALFLLTRAGATVAPKAPAPEAETIVAPVEAPQ